MDERPDCLIFTKDRAAQLQLLLRSIKRHARQFYSNVTILVATSSPEYAAAYKILGRLEFPSPTRFTQRDFKWNVMRWLVASRRSRYVSFLCDDDLFHRDAPRLSEITVPWSLRAGDYDYPFSLDGNIYERDHIIALLDGLTFRDPTELEHQGHLHRDRLPFTTVNHGEPCLIGIPLNRVSDSSGMPHLGVHQYDLNERFLNGERLDYELPEDLVGTHASATPYWTK